MGRKIIILKQLTRKRFSAVVHRLIDSIVQLWRYIILIVLLLLNLNPSFAGEENSFDLDSLYRLAVKQSESIKIAEEELFIASQDRKRAFSVLVPKLTAFGSYAIQENDQTAKARPSDALKTPADLSQTTDTAIWGIRFDHSFSLNGKELTALKISKELIEKNRFDLSAVKEEYLFQVASAYYGILQAQKAKEIGDANVKRLEKHKKAVKARVELEDLTPTDMYRAESELSDAKSHYIDAKNTLRYARAILKNLVNLPSNFILAEPVKSIREKTSEELPLLQDKGLAKRADLKSSKIGYEISKKNQKIAKSAYWPTLSIKGEYAENEITNDGRYDHSKAKTEIDDTSCSIQASLSFTLFDGGLRRAEIKQAAALNRQAKLALATEKKRIRLEIENAFLELETQKSKLEALTDKLKYSNQTYKAVSKQFRQGLSNSVDMMDANTLLVSAERELANALFKYQLAILKLKKATGSFLDETGLNK